MKIIVISDTHRNINKAAAAIRSQRADVLFHLGDLASDAEDLSYLFPDITVYSVRGNNDIFSGAPTDLFLTMGGVNYFLTHGHIYGVKSGIGRLFAHGIKLGTDFILFGHTHQSFDQVIDGVRIMNPSAHGYIIISDNFAEVRKY
jgi:putative phosphoesterase